jgi:predicted flap endonuclease-1-like 5' DNA nuclease
MPELTALHIGIIAAMLAVGGILGWIFRGDRCAKEKIAINAGWQDQIESQQSEHNRLAEQNKSLMEQISQYQGSHREATNRAKELSESLKDSFVQRDELHAQAKVFRSKLEVAIAQRDRLKSENDGRESRGAASDKALKDKDDKIFKLSRELTSWQNRVPPLVEKYQEREQRIRSLENELERAREELHRLEDTVKPDNTRIEPVDAESLPDGLDASNEPHANTSEHEVAALQDQIHEDATDDDAKATLQNDANLLDEDEAGMGSLANGVDLVEEQESAAEYDGESVSASNGSDALETDDLKKIKGVGPAIEKTLKSLGIHRFNQIAEMSEYDIDRVAQQLKGFRSRIYREDWIGQARDLQYRKNSGNS